MTLYDMDDLQTVGRPQPRRARGRARAAPRRSWSRTRSTASRTGWPSRARRRRSRRCASTARRSSSRSWPRTPAAGRAPRRATSPASRRSPASVMQRLLHEPTIRMKALEQGGGHGRLAVLRELFGLDEVPEEAAGRSAAAARDDRRASPPRCASCAAAPRREDRHPRQRASRSPRPGPSRTRSDRATSSSSITTSGDRDRRRRSTKSAGSASWTPRCCDGRIDLAVHSAKDVPAHAGRRASRSPPCRPRADAVDALCGARSLDALPHGARVGTASLRRAAQLRALREDLGRDELRGNVDTRLATPARRRLRRDRARPGRP